MHISGDRHLHLRTSLDAWGDLASSLPLVPKCLQDSSLPGPGSPVPIWLLWAGRKGGDNNRTKPPLGREGPVCILPLERGAGEMVEGGVCDPCPGASIARSLAHTSWAPPGCWGHRRKQAQPSCFLKQDTPRLVLPHGVALSTSVDTVSSLQLELV